MTIVASQPSGGNLRTLVEFKGVGKVYPNGFKAIAPFSLSIFEGEFLTLLGPSGCGKTTTLRMLGGFELPSVGRLELGGKDVTNEPPNRRATNMVFQDYALFPHMTVAENIAFGPTVAGQNPAQIAADVADMLKIVGLSDKKGHMPSQLSGGQRQRVALARALIQRPRLLLLDEPLGALDANMREQMQTELKSIQSRLGITFVMVTHDQHEALTMSDRVVIMNHGEVQQVGTPEDLYERPANTFVASFLGTTNLIDATVHSQAGQSAVVFGGIELVLDAPRAAGAVQIGIRPERIEPAGERAGRNTFTAHITQRTYHGNAGRLVVALADGAALLVDLPIQSFAGLRQEEEIRLYIPPEAIRVFD